MGNACFVAGTLIETANGLKPIESIQYGELIWSREEFGENYAYKPVFANKQTDNQQIFEVVVEHQSGAQETFFTTEEHPFFVEGTGWLKAALLEPEMRLLDRNGNTSFKVVNQKATERFETVYNIKVEDFSTYHIGQFGLWVHNANCCDFTSKYGDVHEQFKQGGWINPENGKVRYLDPFDGKMKDFPDGVTTSVDHIYPQSAFHDIEGFSKLPKEIQLELMNHPLNLQPMPKHLNSSKGSKVEIGGKGWDRYVKEGTNIDPGYREFLKRQQNQVIKNTIEFIENYNKNRGVK